MPEEKYVSTRRPTCNKWRSRVLRWLVLGFGWTTYILYRSFVVGQIKYDSHTRRMIIRPRNMWTKRIALILKIATIYADHFGIQYLFFASLPLLFLLHGTHNHSRMYKDLVDSLVFQIAFWNIGRIYYWLGNLSWNRSFVDLVNEVIHMMSLMEETLGPLQLDGSVLLILFLVQLYLTVFQIVDYLYGKIFILALHVLLLALFYNMYMVYQLILLSWMATFYRFLKTFIQEGIPTLEQRKQLQHLFRLYSRVSKVHRNVMVLWLPVATMLFSNIVLLVAHWSSIIYCILYIDRMDVIEKWHAFLRMHLGGSLAPLLRILLIGLCNDQLAQMQRFLSLQLLIIDLRCSEDPKVQTEEDLKVEQTCFDLQLRSQPIRNQIMSLHQVCSCPFVLEFFFCALLNALNTVQYGLAYGINIFDY